MRFYLGTHEVSWLTRTKVPLFISRRRFARQKSLPRAIGPWALDSGGFTELSMYGEWRTTPEQYVAAVRTYRDEVGLMQWCSPMDWMCEPVMLQKTGRSVSEHQKLTIYNFLTLRDLAPDLPFIPVLQGWEHDDYLRCVDAYEEAGVRLDYEPVVGVGTVCRRQDTATAKTLMNELAAYGLSLHGFGIKGGGVAYADAMTSADSMAWSFRARKDASDREKLGLPRSRFGCHHASCSNCILFALDWRAKLLERLR